MAGCDLDKTRVRKFLNQHIQITSRLTLCHGVVQYYLCLLVRSIIKMMILKGCFLHFKLSFNCKQKRNVLKKESGFLEKHHVIWAEITDERYKQEEMARILKMQS